MSVNAMSWCLFVLHSVSFYIRFLDLFERYGGYQKGRLKLKKPQELQEVLDIARGLLVEAKLHNDPELEEKKPKLEQMKAVLEM